MKQMLLKYLLSIFIFFPLKSFEQSLMHSFGPSLLTTASADETLVNFNFTYYPRYILTSGANSSLTVGVPFAMGVGLLSNVTYDSDTYVALTYDIPVVLDFNVGVKSTLDNDRKMGWYGGLGFGYNQIVVNKDALNYSGKSYGPLFRTGIRFGFRNTVQTMTVGFTFKYPLESEPDLSTRPLIFGMEMLVDL